MTLPKLEKLVIDAFTTLNVSGLLQLDSNALYSGLDKEQIIEEIEKEIKIIRATGLCVLSFQPTTCNFCYPTANAFNFLNKNTGELILRYVIHEENPFDYKVEECKNRAIPDREDGLPF